MVRAKEGFRKLLRRLAGIKVFSKHKDLIANLDSRIRNPDQLSSFLVPGLRKLDLLPEELMEILKVNSKILGVHVGDITFQVNGDSRIVGEERGDSG